MKTGEFARNGKFIHRGVFNLVGQLQGCQILLLADSQNRPFWGGKIRCRPGHATGATKRKPGDGQRERVSIRAPVTRPGRHGAHYGRAAFYKFQSAPRSRDRGDSSRRANWRPWTSFNPRPGHATGATSKGGNIVSEICSFNPRPGHATGATRTYFRIHAACAVSIRAPVTRPGRPARQELTNAAPLFQSAPRSRDRGDRPF